MLDAKYINESTVGDGAGSAALVTGLRTALVACVAAIGAALALVYTARNYRLTRRGQVTERFTKALERLGSDEIYVRIGGVLAMEQIVQDAPEQATHAAQVLGHFVRERTREAPLKSPEADVQATLTALTRPGSRSLVDEHEYLDLRNLRLAWANLSGADLTEARLSRADLTSADLRGADLNHAWLTTTILIGADMSDADLTHVSLVGANLTGADLRGANLSGAHLATSSLTGADLTGANLTGANLAGADLTGTNLNRANLACADLTEAKGATTNQVCRAHVVDSTRLPPDIEAAVRPPAD
ncbi:pentapeptide repeat-containing protein [Streptomyces sp. SCA3-4]|uniref:pentapeptide repeat-containing protein n=1 Tax=Streptomyces sichuanensis TaxID=2871810 RepID=UPI001CE25911|nr:pentapeptide repeat-containing protein [Streptomyces sichuanensis]MCA6095849.1 pentapeptide repeat-containing protein [Streptomyces sichuanensis]